MTIFDVTVWLKTLNSGFLDYSDRKLDIKTSSSRIEKLFLHYFDIHFIEDKGAAINSPGFKAEMRMATRIAVASAYQVIIPTASYFESQACREIIDELGTLKDIGIIELIGSSTNIDEFVRERLDSTFYKEGSRQHIAYEAGLRATVDIPYLRREKNTTRDISDKWKSLVQSDELARRLHGDFGDARYFEENRLEQVPTELGGAAFISEYVLPILDIKSDAPPLLRTRIKDIINEAYFSSYINELGAGVIVDLSYLAGAFVPSAGRNVSYRKMLRYLTTSGRFTTFKEATPEQLIAMGEELGWKLALEEHTSYTDAASASIKALNSGHSVSISVKADNHHKESALEDNVIKEKILCVVVSASEQKSVIQALDAAFGKGIETAVGENWGIYYRDIESCVEWCVFKLSFQGEAEAAAAVKELLHEIKPSLSLMIGMCMAVDRDLPLGSVVLPNEIFHLDHSRFTTEGNTYRPHGARVDNSLYKLSELVAVRNDEEQTGYKVVTSKALATATVKIEDRNAPIVQFIENSLPDAVSFDMEGGGFYLATKGARSLWIKAVADHGDPQASKENKAKFQTKVTENAIDFAIKLSKKLAGAG